MLALTLPLFYGGAIYVQTRVLILVSQTYLFTYSPASLKEVLRREIQGLKVLPVYRY